MPFTASFHPTHVDIAARRADQRLALMFALFSQELGTKFKTYGQVVFIYSF
jgi:hypothetical protein